MKIGILEAGDFSKTAISKLRKIAKIEIYKGGDMQKFLKDKQVIFVRLGISFDKTLLEAAVHLKIICSPTTGLNHIDQNFCRHRGIRIISLKGEKGFLKTIRATPEHTLGLLIALKRNYHSAFMNEKRNKWNRDLYKGYEIYGSNIGIIGLGRVGSLLSAYLKTMGANISYFDIDPRKNKTGLNRKDSISSLIQSSDTVILCSSYTENDAILIAKKEIDSMKDKYFINTARAELTDEHYLVSKAMHGHFKGIAIDVIQAEQSGKTHLLKWLKAASKHNVIVTPHIGGATYTSMERTELFITEKLINWIESE